MSTALMAFEALSVTLEGLRIDGTHVIPLARDIQRLDKRRREDLRNDIALKLAIGFEDDDDIIAIPRNPCIAGSSRLHLDTPMFGAQSCMGVGDGA